MSESDSIVVRNLQDSPAMRIAAVRIFVDAYFDQLSRITQDKDKLIRVFHDAILLERFYGAFLAGDLVGIFALTDSDGRGFKLKMEDFAKSLGPLRGVISFLALKKELEHPIRLREAGFYVEAVATSVWHRNMGIATTMMKYAMDANEYLELDVLDTNAGAYRIYERLGFKTFREARKRFFRKLVGYNKRIFMSFRRARAE